MCEPSQNKIGSLIIGTAPSPQKNLDPRFRLNANRRDRVCLGNMSDGFREPFSSERFEEFRGFHFSERSPKVLSRILERIQEFCGPQNPEV